MTFDRKRPAVMILATAGGLFFAPLVAPLGVVVLWGLFYQPDNTGCFATLCLNSITDFVVSTHAFFFPTTIICAIFHMCFVKARKTSVFLYLISFYVAGIVGYLVHTYFLFPGLFSNPDVVRVMMVDGATWWGLFALVNGFCFWLIAVWPFRRRLASSAATGPETIRPR